MKTAFLTYAFIFCVFTINTIAQTPDYYTRINFYIGGNYNPYQMSDPGGQIVDEMSDGVAGGFELSVDYSDNFSVGSGLIIKPYTFAVNFKGASFAVASNGMNTLQIPVYLRARKDFGRENFATIAALGGGALAINQSRTKMTTLKNSAFDATSETATDLVRAFPLIFAGASVDFQLVKKDPVPEDWLNLEGFRFGISGRRFFGFTDVMKVHTEYSGENNSLIMATQNFRGGYWMFNLHLIYAIEN